MFILGLFKSVLDGFGAVLGKNRLEKMEFGVYQKTYTMLNFLVISPIMIVMLALWKDTTSYKVLDLGALVSLAFYLILRIISNTSQNKLLANKEIDVNTVNILMAFSAFLSLIGCVKEVTPLAVIAMLTSCFGVICVTINFKQMSFKFDTKSAILLLLAFLANGTRTLMCNHLLNYFSPFALTIVELVNYMVMYLIIHRKSKVNKEAVIAVLPLVLVCLVCLPLSFVVAKTIQISIITSFASTVSTAILSLLFFHKPLKVIEYFGICLVLFGLAIFKIYCI